MNQDADVNADARRDEAAGQLQTLVREKLPFFSDWQVEEAVRRYLDRNGDPASVDRILTQLRNELESAPLIDFGTWLRGQLEQRGWNQSDLARRIESYPSLVSKWIRDLQRPQPRQCA